MAWEQRKIVINANINLEEVGEQDLYPSFKEEARALLQKYEKTLLPEMPGSIQNIQINFDSSPPKALTNESLEQFLRSTCAKTQKEASKCRTKNSRGIITLECNRKQ